MYKTSSHIVQEIAQNHIQQIVDIADQQFGEGFLTFNEAKQYLQEEHLIGHVVTDEDVVLGFSLMQIGMVDEIFDQFQSIKEELKSNFNQHEKVAYRSLTAVTKSAEGKGVASQLVKAGISFLKNKVDLIICDAWKSDHIHIGNILEKNGYQCYREIPNYWTVNSINESYECKVCGAPPCECVGVIYVLDLKGDVKGWWSREDLMYSSDFLHFNSIKLSDYCHQKETPFYVYSLDRIAMKIEGLKTIILQHELDLSIHYAMKANRHPRILQFLSQNAGVNIDVCSPNELAFALENGFDIEQVSYTGTSLSNRDIDVLTKHSKLHLNLDALSSIRRFGEKNPGRSIGLRFNPEIGLGYNESLEYTNRVVKFGLYEEQIEEAIELTKTYDLTVNTLHVHCGSGYLSDQLLKFERILEKVEQLIKRFPSVDTVNIGGGLGVPQSEGDALLDLNEWGRIIKNFQARTGVRMRVEPGDYIVKDAGLLIIEVNTVETKKGITFVGLDAGMNMNNEYAYYQMNLEPLPLQRKGGEKVLYTLAGNINEPVDLFAENKRMEQLEEGDLIALINAGGYGASSSSNHCMRGNFDEYFIEED